MCRRPARRHSRRLSLMAALGAPSIWQAEAPGWKAYAGTAAMVLLALGLGLAWQQYLASLNIALVFLTAVLAAPSPMGYGRHCSPACSACWPTISSSCRRSTPSRSPIRERRRAVLLRRWWRSSPATSRRGCGLRPWRRGAREDDRRSLSLQPQARRHRHAGRSAVGDGLSDRRC